MSRELDVLPLIPDVENDVCDDVDNGTSQTSTCGIRVEMDSNMNSTHQQSAGFRIAEDQHTNSPPSYCRFLRKKNDASDDGNDDGYLVLGIVTIFVNPPIGLLALFLAMTARSYRANNQLQISRRLRFGSMCLIVFGFFVTVVGVAIAVGITEHRRQS